MTHNMDQGYKKFYRPGFFSMHWWRTLHRPLEWIFALTENTSGAQDEIYVIQVSSQAS